MSASPNLEPDVQPSASGARLVATEARRSPRQRVLAAVRKTHMYLGLALFPWVAFFGASGMLFNHPGVGESVHARPISSDELHEHAGIAPVDPSRIAREVIANLAREGQSYRVDPEHTSRFHGSVAFEARGEDVRHLVLVNLAAGRGIALTRPDHAPAAAPFAREMQIEAHRVSSLEPGASGLLEDLGIEAEGPLRLNRRIAPTLRFRMIDAEGVRWNVTYDLGTGRLDGRRTDDAPDLSLHDLLGEMHKTHHFPPEIGPTTFWALFADLTGLTLILWALTGIVMWWQIKRSRALGVVALSTGVLIAAWVMIATHDELRFGNVRASEPGGPPMAEPETSPAPTE